MFYFVFLQETKMKDTANLIFYFARFILYLNFKKL
jgi:hypothetical protein